MKIYKILLICFIFSFCFNNCIAQTNDTGNITSFSTSLLKWVEEFNARIDSFFVKEKAQRLDRKLNYFKNDIKDYLKIRKILMDKLTANNYNISEPATKQTVQKLRAKLDKLEKQLTDIENYANSALPDSSNKMITKVQYHQQQQEVYIGVLENLIENLVEGKKVNKAKLASDGREIYEKLLGSVGIISVIQSQLQIKFNY